MSFGDWRRVFERQEVLTPTTQVNAGRLRSVRTAANEDAATVAVEKLTR
jgi:hypothetical protein